MKLILLLLCAGFPHILSVRGEVPYQQKCVCIDATETNHLGNYLIGLLQNYDENQTLKIEEVEEAFVPDLYNTSSFLVPRLVYVLFTCNNSEDMQDIIDDERAFVWTSEYLFAYMHPAVIRLVSLLDVTLLGPSVHTLRMCIPNICSNATKAFSFQEAILKVRESVFHRKANAFLGRVLISTHFTFPETWKSYLYHQTGYTINLHEALPKFYIATYSLFMSVFFLALFIGTIVTIAFSLQIIDKLVICQQSVHGNTKRSIQVFYQWSGVFSTIVCCQVLLMFVCYLIASFKELSSDTYPDLSYFSIMCHAIAYLFIWFIGFCCACCLPQFLAKKYFKNKLSLLINRRSCGCSDRLVLGFALVFCTMIFYHILFGLVVFLHYPLLVICVLVSRLTYLAILGLCVFTSIRLYMTFGIRHIWIYSSAFIQIVIICLYYSVLYGVATMLGIGYTLENSVLLKYIIMSSFVSVGVIVISYYVYIICCKPLFYSEKELLKVRRQKKREDGCNEMVINMSELSPSGAGNNEVAMINPMAHAPNKVVYFAGGVLLIKDGNVTWIPVDQK